MQYDVASVEEYLEAIPEERKAAFNKLRETILKNIPQGYEEVISYGMIGYVVPHTIYPDGYHCDPKLPLPFVSIASQKNFIGFYHMGIYAYPEILAWFKEEFPKYNKLKLDMGKSCIHFKKPDQIPYKLLAQLLKKISVKKWIGLYEEHIKK